MTIFNRPRIYEGDPRSRLTGVLPPCRTKSNLLYSLHIKTTECIWFCAVARRRIKYASMILNAAPTRAPTSTSPSSLITSSSRGCNCKVIAFTVIVFLCFCDYANRYLAVPIDWIASITLSRDRIVVTCPQVCSCCQRKHTCSTRPSVLLCGCACKLLLSLSSVLSGQDCQFISSNNSEDYQWKVSS